MILTGGAIISLNSGLIVMSKKYILNDENLKRLKKKLKNSKNIFLFLDYDGTLAPFRDDPLNACALPEIEKELKKLSKKEKYHLNLVSGRKLSELKKMINLSRTNYAGSHGLEIDIFFKKEIIYPAQDKEIDILSKRSYKKTKEKFSEMKSVKVEDKGFGFALHFSSESKQKEVKNELLTLFENKAYQVLCGRKIIEIRPEGWDKGKAINYLSSQLRKKLGVKQGLRIYIGDDRTDEDAFQVLKKGISIYVQNEDDLNTKAEFYLKNPKDTAKLLKELTGSF